MATGKAQKKDKLRHAEYYDFQEIQDMLYACLLYTSDAADE